MHWLNHIRGHIVPPEECVEQAHSLGLDRAYRNVGAAAGAGFGGLKKFTPLSLSGCVVWSESDFGTCTFDTGAPGTTYVTIPSKGTLAGFTNATKATQPTLSTLNGKNSALFVSASTNLLTTQAAKADYKFIHGGGGATIAIVSRAVSLSGTTYTLATARSATSHGFYFGHTLTGAVITRFGNGSGTYLIDNTSSAGKVSTSATARMIFTYSETEATKWNTDINEASVGSGGTTGSPSTSNSTYDMIIGRLGGGGGDYNGHVPLVVIYNRVLNAAEKTKLANYMKRWGA